MHGIRHQAAARYRTSRCTYPRHYAKHCRTLSSAFPFRHILQSIIARQIGTLLNSPPPAPTRLLFLSLVKSGRLRTLYESATRSFTSYSPRESVPYPTESSAPNFPPTPHTTHVPKNDMYRRALPTTLGTVTRSSSIFSALAVQAKDQPLGVLDLLGDEQSVYSDGTSRDEKASSKSSKGSARRHVLWWDRLPERRHEQIKRVKRKQ